MKNLNIFGLALGLATCIFISIYVIDELSYDRYNVNAARIFRIAADLRINGGTINDIFTPSPMASTLAKDFPAIENAVRIRAFRRDVAVHIGAQVFLEKDAVLADPSLFSIFTLPMIDGDPKTALTNPNAVVLSETAARRFFNATDIIGRTMTMDEDTTVYMVTGIIRDMPAQSHFHFQLIRSMQNHRQEWINFYAATYVLARPGVTTADLDRMLTQTVEKYVNPQIQRELHNSAEDVKRNGDQFGFYSIPLTRIHLYSNLGSEFEANGNGQYVLLFIAVAILILVVACINFINLTIARSLRKLKEIGIRKVLGSTRQRLATQFLVESMLAALLAMTVALILVIILLPIFDRLTGKTFDASILISHYTIPVALLTTGTAGLLSGGYPAFLLSGINPLTILKGQIAPGLRTGAFRTALLVFQFSIAMILMISTGVIWSQLHYIRHRSLGYNREQVLTVKDTRSLGDEAWTFANETKKIPGVMNVTVSGFLPNQKVVARGFFKDIGRSETSTVLLGDWHIDANYLPTLNMTILQGRNFSLELPTDSTKALINETAARALGYPKPIGQKIYTADSAETYTIIGVVRDFNTGSLRNPIDPVVFRLDRDGNAVTFRLSPHDIPGTLNAIRKTFQQVANGQAFVYSFLDDDFNRLYQTDQRTGNLFTIFSMLSIFIAGMGIFGLVTAATEQRTKELGIRRVLGARLVHLSLLLAKDYGLAIGIAILIALPTGAWLMHGWLQGFAYRTGLQTWIFLVAPLLAMALGAAIVGAKAGQTTRRNLAKTLHVE